MCWAGTSCTTNGNPATNRSTTRMPEHPPTSSKHRRWPHGISSTAGGMGEEAWSRCQSYGGNPISATTRHGTSLCGRMLDLWYGWTLEGLMPSSTRKSNMHQPMREPMASHMWYNARTNQSGEHHPCSAHCSRSVWVHTGYTLDSRIGTQGDY